MRGAAALAALLPAVAFAAAGASPDSSEFLLLAQVATLVVGASEALRALARLPLDVIGEASGQAAIEHQRLDHVTRNIRPADHA